VPDLTSDRLARLRRLAALARDRDVDSDAVALFSAAVSPDVVTALLDEIERLRGIVLEAAANSYPATPDDYCEACDASQPLGPDDHDRACWWRLANEERRHG
jgi:hypothetical protein